MEDGTPKYCAATTRLWHIKLGVNLFSGWPGNSPDLNPMEMLWLKQR